MGKRSKLAIFPHYWNGEKEWGKNINNGEKLLMKMGKILVWIPLLRVSRDHLPCGAVVMQLIASTAPYLPPAGQLRLIPIYYAP